MTAILGVSLAAFLTSLLTLFSGFGLGTLLLPIFMLLFPVEVAVAATAVVHLSNNLFKAALLGKFADRGIVLRFGLPAIPAAMLGALALTALSGSTPLAQYSLGARTFVVTADRLVISLLILVFAILDLAPGFSRVAFGRRWMPAGGMLSGFIGGLSGHQGALRSAFLAKCGLGREAFIGTGILCAILVDLSRIPVYLHSFSGDGSAPFGRFGWMAVGPATLSAFAGAYLGARMIHKVTLESIHRLVGALLIVLSIALAAGLV